MRRRAKPAKTKAEGKRRPAPNSPVAQDARIRDLEKGLAEAREQQTATSALLKVIGRSNFDLQPVFEALAENALRLCEAEQAAIFRFDGQVLRAVVTRNLTPENRQFLEQHPIRPGRESGAGRAAIERRTVHIHDVKSDPDYAYGAGQLPFRTLLSMPMLRGDALLGAISIQRDEVRPFTESQIALLEIFADQAVIAIENVRLFTELQASNRELTTALDTQTATSDILRVISRSQTDVRPVFDAIVNSAVRLLRARSGTLSRIVGDQIELAAHTSTDDTGDAATRAAFPQPLSFGGVHAQTIRNRAPLNIVDAQTDPRLPEATHTYARVRGYRSQGAVPMLRHDEAVGAIAVTRYEPGGFTDDEIVLLQTFANQAVIAIENVRLFSETKEALEQQTATAEILRVISSSPTNLQPVLETVAENAARVCGAIDAQIYRVEGEFLHWVASHGPIPPNTEERLISRGWVTGRAVVDRRTIHVHDLAAESDTEYPVGKAAQRLTGHRTTLATPLLREGIALGVISIRRMEVRPFSEKQVRLLETFADQAVIAIENVHLFTELQEKNLALTEAHGQVTEALEQQTATSEILNVISRSPTDVQPVLDTVVEHASRLCSARDAQIFRREGAVLRIVAHHGPIPTGRVGEFTMPITRGTVNGRAIMDQRAFVVADLQAESAAFPEGSTISHNLGHRSVLSVPLMREGVAIGTLSVRRAEVLAFTDAQVALLQTFADQAVIAIENVRLFTELQEKNQALTAAHAQVTEALDQQTATSEILRAIAHAQTDVQPVFDTIVQSAVRLCDGLFSALFQFDGELIHHVAQHNFTPEALEEMLRIFPARPTRALLPGRAILDRSVVHIPDVLELDPEFRVQAVARRLGIRSGVWVPMLWEGTPIGVITVTRAEPGSFSDSEIELLKTFADQAVIAVENVRLFKELQERTGELTRSVDELRALGEIGQAISSTLDLRAVLSTIVVRATQLSGTDAGVIYEYDESREVFVPRATEHLEAEIVETMLATPIRKGEGATGRLAETQEPIQVPDILAAPAESRVRGALVRAGYRALLAVPLVREDHLLGGLTVIRKATGAFAPEVIELLRTFATQSALAIQNARLFREIADKGQELEAASRHKSEFLANMSHELRTPLNAIIGFSEVLAERMFGDVNAKQAEYLQDILESGRHLLSLINDILDLSKIEAGHMELEPADFDLPGAIENALTLVRERATRRGIMLGSTIDKRLGLIRGDERKVKQILLNLLSNALKFTPEGGRIDVGGRLDGEVAEVSVADTGIGIAPADQEAVFEEFRQVGAAERKAEGTGLGLALSRKFVELHGGKIWVRSELDHGSTFTFTLPVADKKF